MKAAKKALRLIALENNYIPRKNNVNSGRHWNVHKLCSRVGRERRQVQTVVAIAISISFVAEAFLKRRKVFKGSDPLK